MCALEHTRLGVRRLVLGKRISTLRTDASVADSTVLLGRLKEALLAGMGVSLIHWAESDAGHEIADNLTRQAVLGWNGATVLCSLYRLR